MADEEQDPKWWDDWQTEVVEIASSATLPIELVRVNVDTALEELARRIPEDRELAMGPFIKITTICYTKPKGT